MSLYHHTSSRPTGTWGPRQTVLARAKQGAFVATGQANPPKHNEPPSFAAPGGYATATTPGDYRAAPSDYASAPGPSGPPRFASGRPSAASQPQNAPRSTSRTATPAPLAPTPQNAPTPRLLFPVEGSAPLLTQTAMSQCREYGRTAGAADHLAGRASNPGEAVSRYYSPIAMTGDQWAACRALIMAAYVEGYAGPPTSAPASPVSPSSRPGFVVSPHRLYL